MTLAEAIAAAGMTPPREIFEGRWLRFPGIGKGRANRAGWCRIITPTLAIFGDWSSGVSETWRDDSHRDDEYSRHLLAQARERELIFAANQRARQERAAREAAAMIGKANIGAHPYLARKGFPEIAGLVLDGKLVIPVRDALDYGDIISAQLIDESGEKRFLTGGRTRHGVHRLGVAPDRVRRLVLCEGYATGLSLDAALQRLPGPHCVVVCFSARNLETVAQRFKLHDVLICADNDESRTGEESAKRTGLPWVMPPEVGTDFNDLMLREGVHAVVEALRTMS